MPNREIKHPDKAADTGAYSAAVARDGWLYISGQGPLDLVTGEIVGQSIEEQTQLTLEHIDKMLGAAGCTRDDVVKCACHLRDIEEFDRFNTVYGNFFNGTARPARTTVQSTLWGGIRVEIDAIAKLPDNAAVAKPQSAHNSEAVPEPVAVVGLGLLGRGIVSCLLGRGLRVKVYSQGLDADYAGARPQIERELRELVERTDFPLAILGALDERYQETHSLEELSDCGFVIESITEDQAAKLRLFEQLETIVAPDVPIASNTSAIPVATIQQGRQHPQRFVGMHWSEPAHNTRFLEIIPGPQTDAATLDATARLARRCGKDPSLLNKDVRGFITNRLMYALFREAIHLLESGVADVATIDRSFRNGVGWYATLAGPFRLMDITGLPAYGAVMRDLLPELSNQQTVPAPMQRLMEEGAQGIVNGHGWYSYTPAEARQWEEKWAEFSWEVRQLADRFTPMEDADAPAN